MSADKLYLEHVTRASRVLAAWFDDAKFRAAWAPEVDLFVTDQQRAVAEICAAKGPDLDRDQVVYLLSRTERWKRLAGDAAELYAVMEGPVVLDPWQELEALREIAAQRALRQRLAETLAKVDGGLPLADSRALLSDALSASAVGTGSKPRTRREVMATALRSATSRDVQPGARTISKALDRATGGMRHRKCWVIAAPSNWGKTSVLVALDAQFCADGWRTLICSGEDEEELFGQRMIAAQTKADALRIRDGRLQQWELKAAANAVASAPDHPCFLDITGQPAEKVAADIRSLVLSEQIDFVFIDYVQVFRLEKARDNMTKREELWQVARLFKDAVKGAGAGLILFSQITEDEKTGKRKTRDAEDIQHLADVVLFGKSEFEQALNSGGEKTHRIEKKAFWVQKVKNGPKNFDVPLQWDPGPAAFISDYDEPRAGGDLPFDEDDRREYDA